MSERTLRDAAFQFLAACFVSASPIYAADIKSPPASDGAPAIKSLAVYPEKITLKGRDDSRQVIVTATLANGQLHDLTGDMQFEVAAPQIARVTSSGRVSPQADGQTQLVGIYGDHKVTIPIDATAVGQDLPINFPNQVVPIFTKLGCNGGGCHGKASGQNGFRLSLLGFEPELDFTTLVKESRGRRLFPASPENSLLLLKATGTIAHAGGKRMDVGSDEYNVIRRWIAAGMPYGRPTDPVVAKISVIPPHRVMARQGKQQFAVLAHYSDGSVEDITRRAQYESNDTEIATVEPSGVVHTQSLSGEAAVMARYQGQVTVFRATVPLGIATPAYQFPHQTLVDGLTQKKWQQLGLVPSELCTDEQFIRRVSLDITGTLPIPAEVAAFIANKDAKKRERLVDALLERPEYAYFFANKWADILHVKRKQQPNAAEGTFAFHHWIRSWIAEDQPYDQFAREILTATGDEVKNPPTVWYKEITNPEQFVDDTAQVFLGMRLACAQCHHHPYEKWSQDDYWGLAAFIGKLGRKNVPLVTPNPSQGEQKLVVFNRPTGGNNVRNKRTGQPAPLKPLDAPPMGETNEDPREKLVEWMVAPANPFFARAVANRYWAHFFGRGLVDPLDDMRVTNPPSNAELLDALAKDFVDHKHSLKHLVRTICNSRTYQLSASPNEFNKQDKQAYSRFYPRRMSAEVLFDAVCQVTDSPANFGGIPQDRHAPRRAIMLPDESFASYFLDVFGRPQRMSACECERVSEANLAQALHLLNSDEVQGRLNRAGGRADVLAKDARPDAEKVAELFLWALGHPPSADQLKLAVAHITQNAANKKLAYENILWALINTKEFVFIQ
jgi:hypothetical protein